MYETVSSFIFSANKIKIEIIFSICSTYSFRKKFVLVAFYYKYLTLFEMYLYAINIVIKDAINAEVEVHLLFIVLVVYLANVIVDS